MDIITEGNARGTERTFMVVDFDAASGSDASVILAGTDAPIASPKKLLFPCDDEAAEAFFAGVTKLPILIHGPKINELVWYLDQKIVFYRGSVVPRFNTKPLSQNTFVLRELHGANLDLFHELYGNFLIGTTADKSLDLVCTAHVNAIIHGLLTWALDFRGSLRPHIRVLHALAKDCESVLELGSGDCTSSKAFLAALSKAPKSCVGNIVLNAVGASRRLYGCDLKPSRMFTDLIVPVGHCAGVECKFFNQNDLSLELTDPFDMIFIDTLHVYGQLKRELEKFHPLAKKYIVLHDTTIDGDLGEVIRDGLGPDKVTELSVSTSIPEPELLKGLWPAVTEFLSDHPEWTVMDRLTDVIGLTILRR